MLCWAAVHNKSFCLFTCWNGLNRKSTGDLNRRRLRWTRNDTNTVLHSQGDDKARYKRAPSHCLAAAKLCLICVTNKSSSGVGDGRTSIQLATPASALFRRLLSLFAARPSVRPSVAWSDPSGPRKDAVIHGAVEERYTGLSVAVLFSYTASVVLW